MITKYPYYIIPDIEALETATDSQQEELHRRRIAANIGDREALMRILGVTSIDPDNFYPDQKAPEMDTEDTIEAFLDKFGGASTMPEADPDEPLPIAPAVDYLTLLEMEKEREKSGGTKEKIERPKTQPEAALRVDRREENRPATPDLTESFAKILIKNGNYSRAREILEQLHLKNSEKSIYFADQMRFLRRLEAIQALRNEKK